MKKLLLLVTLSFLCVSANAVSLSWVSSKLAGGGTVPSIDKEVEAHGWDFRQYTWADPAGRICTVTFTDKKGGALDCDFPPKNFDYKAFYKEAK